MSWRKYRLGEVCSLFYGKSLDDYVEKPDEDYSFRAFGTNGPIGWAREPLIDEPTIIVGRKGAYRGVRYSNEPSWTIDTAFFTKVNRRLVNAKWLFYRLLLVDINSMNSGGAIPSTSRNDFYSVSICVPDQQIQSRIADVLSSYDDLIENNQRRIALLEESARLLYREWFVYFRFPGHEHVKIIDGLPEGWTMQELSNVCAPHEGIQTGPFGSQLHQSDYCETGVPVIMPRDIKYLRVSVDEISYISEEMAEKLGRHRMNIGDIVYGRRGEIGRRAFIGEMQEGWICGTGCLRIRPDSYKINQRYLFEALGADQSAGFIKSQAKGSTMLNLNAGSLKKVPTLCPPRNIQDKFAEMVRPHYSAVETLLQQNQKLAQARDLLLPRLMSGEISV